MKINRFEDLEVWQEARILVRMVYNIINDHEKLSRNYNQADKVAKMNSNFILQPVRHTVWRTGRIPLHPDLGEIGVWSFIKYLSGNIKYKNSMNSMTLKTQ